MSIEDLLEELADEWAVSKTGSGAIWVDTRGHHLAVMKDRGTSGCWLYRIGKTESKTHDYSKPVYRSEAAAKRAVVGELLKRLGTARKA